jgi:hypothetical protein
MANPIINMQLGGYASVANSGNASTGAGKLGSTVAVTYWSDSTFTYVDAATGRTYKLDSGMNPDVGKLLKLLLVGANGLPAANNMFMGMTA